MQKCVTLNKNENRDFRIESGPNHFIAVKDTNIMHASPDFSHCDQLRACINLKQRWQVSAQQTDLTYIRFAAMKPAAQTCLDGKS